MTEKLLRAKHWQLFMLVVVIPFTLQFIAIGFMISKMLSGAPSVEASTLLKISQFVMVIFIAVYFRWFWAVAIGLQKKVPLHVKMKVNKFKVFFLIPVAYIFTMLTVLIFFTDSFMLSESEPLNDLFPSYVGIIVPLHLLSMFGLFYSMYFVAKTIRTVELQNEVSFGDFAGEFFLIWFYPIGIWIVQPKVNRLMEEREDIVW